MGVGTHFDEGKTKQDKKLYKYIKTDLLPLVLKDLEKDEQMRIRKEEKIQQEEAARLAAEEQERLRIEEENLQAALELERQSRARYEVRSTRTTRRGPSVPEKVVKSAAEVCFL